MGAPQLFTGGLRGLAQRLVDLGGYVWHRTLMRLRYQVRRLRHRLAFCGRPKRILVVRLASIGDVVRATAVVERLRAEYPQAAIDVLTTSAALPVITHHPAVRAVYTLESLERLQDYDWIVNLQTRDPPASFLQGSGWAYPDVLQHLSTRFPSALHSGRRVLCGRESVSTNILYCRSEVEELFMIALLPFDAEQYPDTRVHVDASARAEAARKFPLPVDRPAVGVFLGSNSVGCGADEGFRMYSLDYLEQLIERLSRKFTVVMIGQSQVRNAAERERYRQLLRKFPCVVDLVDRTSLTELVAVIGRLTLLVSSDSSPVHIALASGVPVVGLYVSDATFRMSPRTEQPTFVAIDSKPPCFYYSWRWRFFCSSCRDEQTRARFCPAPTMAFGVDRIPLGRVEDAADRLLAGPQLAESPRHAHSESLMRTP